MKDSSLGRADPQQGRNNIGVSIAVMNLKRQIKFLGDCNVLLKRVLLHQKSFLALGAKIIEPCFAHGSDSRKLCEVSNFRNRNIKFFE